MQRNFSDFGIFNIVEIAKNLSQKEGRMQKHVQQSNIEESEP